MSGTVKQLPSSKSISNRALILNALTGNRSVVSNLSSARDTKLMQALINSNDEDHSIDVMDAGTTMRFLTSFFALTNKKKILTGTDRMKQRPIKLLVDALRLIGAEISYLGGEGFPPIQTLGFESQKTDFIEMPGNVSSQYISALMMLAPTLPKGLTIQLKGETGSIPYINMTASLMKEFGVEPQLDFKLNIISIKHGAYRPASVTIEADWSAASYWLAFVALAEEAKIILPNVSEKSLQGDRVVVEVMKKLGVNSDFKNGSLELTKRNSQSHISWDFKDCPDLAQTVLPVCAAKGISGEFTGLESLRIKETDRIAALKNELKKIGAKLEEPETGKWKLTPGKIATLSAPIETYHDHRMAMGFAPWAALTDITILAPEVVNKSYPGFWEDVKSVGYTLSEER
ncbi:MAG: 3-phosphoshikimate 1-carboxyvinyltransferase [Bacteroidetes bacterium]|nr:3-phosphoshikimate 1-carboxyvinyltransferase [Bacteroidota bacterium]